MNKHTLVDSIIEGLDQFGYSEPQATIIIDGAEGAVIARPRRWMCRYVCVVMQIPERCQTLQDTELFFEKTRRELTERYAKFPYWKEVGAYLVWICGDDLFQRLETQMTKFKDSTGYHMTVMLGTVLVNRDQYTISSESTWGLYYSGSHFGALRAKAIEWCMRMRNEQGAISGSPNESSGNPG